MLPFGSITSIIPLSVLAIAYALFICASALNRIKPATGDSQEKEIVVKTFDNTEGQSGKHILFYNDIQDVITPEECNEAFRSPLWFCSRLVPIPPETVYSGYVNFLFSRPPPSFFSYIVS